jgi:hypothetical protein
MAVAPRRDIDAIAGRLRGLAMTEARINPRWRVRGRSIPTEPPWRIMRALVAVAFVSAAIQYSLTFNGLRGVGASIAVLVIQLEVPFLVLLGAALLHERVGLRKWLNTAAARPLSSRGVRPTPGNRPRRYRRRRAPGWACR